MTAVKSNRDETSERTEGGRLYEGRKRHEGMVKRILRENIYSVRLQSLIEYVAQSKGHVNPCNILNISNRETRLNHPCTEPFDFRKNILFLAVHLWGGRVSCTNHSSHSRPKVWGKEEVVQNWTCLVCTSRIHMSYT